MLGLCVCGRAGRPGRDPTYDSWHRTGPLGLDVSNTSVLQLHTWVECHWGQGPCRNREPEVSVRALQSVLQWYWIELN